MPANRDAQLIETVQAHRARLHAALLYGDQPDRRAYEDNLRRLLVSLVLATLGSLGCVAYAVVAGFLRSQGGS